MTVCGGGVRAHHVHYRAGSGAAGGCGGRRVSVHLYDPGYAYGRQGARLPPDRCTTEALAAPPAQHRVTGYQLTWSRSSSLTHLTPPALPPICPQVPADLYAALKSALKGKSRTREAAGGAPLDVNGEGARGGEKRGPREGVDREAGGQGNGKGRAKGKAEGGPWRLYVERGRWGRVFRCVMGGASR